MTSKRKKHDVCFVWAIVRIIAVFCQNMYACSSIDGYDPKIRLSLFITDKTYI